MRNIKINTDVPLDERGQNANIKFHVLDKETMELYGFRHTYGQWIYSIGLTDTISMTIIINDNEKEGIINILDDDFLQHYDFQSMIINNEDKAPKIAKTVQNKVYKIMSDLVYEGIISGWNIGDYI